MTVLWWHASLASRLRSKRHLLGSTVFTGLTDVANTVAYLGVHWAMAPLLWPEHKIFFNTLNQKFFFKFLGRGHSPFPRPLLQWGGDTPSPHSTPLAPPAPRTSRLWLWPPLHKILNTLLSQHTRKHIHHVTYEVCSNRPHLCKACNAAETDER